MCGLALDFCCLDTAINAAALGFNEVYMVLDACRAAHIEKVGEFGTGFLQSPRDLLPKLEKAGVKPAWATDVCGSVALGLSSGHLDVGASAHQQPFPSVLAPLGFDDLGSDGVQFVRLLGEEHYSVDMERGDLKILAKLGWMKTGKCSKAAPILPGWPAAPEDATHVCWAHPLADSAPQMSTTAKHAFLNTSQSLEFHFALRGGFLLLSKLGEVLKVQLVIPADESKERIEFGPPLPIPEETIAALKVRFQDITLQHLLENGARRFCWLSPGEHFPGFTAPERGAFAYAMQEGGSLCFPVKGFGAKPAGLRLPPVSVGVVGG